MTLWKAQFPKTDQVSNSAKTLAHKSYWSDLRNNQERIQVMQSENRHICFLPESSWRLIAALQKQYHIDYLYFIMSAMATQITGVSIVCAKVRSGTDQRKHQSSTSLTFVREIHWRPVDSSHKWPVTWKMFSIWWRHHDSDDTIRGHYMFGTSTCMDKPCPLITKWDRLINLWAFTPINYLKLKFWRISFEFAFPRSFFYNRYALVQVPVRPGLDN